MNLIQCSLRRFSHQASWTASLTSTSRIDPAAISNGLAGEQCS